LRIATIEVFNIRRDVGRARTSGAEGIRLFPDLVAE